MNVTLILDAAAPSFLTQAQDLRAFLRAGDIGAESCALWLFFRTQKPERLPAFDLPVRQVIWLRLPDEPDVAEQRLVLLEQAWQADPAQLLLFTDRAAGAELAARLAYRLNGSACAGVERGRVSAQACEADKTVYANNMDATLAPGPAPWCLSVMRTGGGSVAVSSLDAPQREISLTEPRPDWLVAIDEEAPQTENALLRADRVLAIGQGVGSAESLQHLQPLAERLRAEIGVSRPVAMNHWCGMEKMLGMSGAVVAPEICIVAGASGAAAFEEGIRRSRFIVAINRDPEAAVFAGADVSIVDDMHAVLDGLAQYLE